MSTYMIFSNWTQQGVEDAREVPSKEATLAVHREAHGLVADEVIEVQEGK